MNTIILRGQRVLHKPGSLQFQSFMGARSVVDCEVPDKTASYNFIKGTKVAIYDDKDLQVTPSYATEFDGATTLESTNYGNIPRGTLRIKFRRDRTDINECLHYRSYKEAVLLTPGAQMSLVWSMWKDTPTGWPQGSNSDPGSNYLPCPAGDHDLFIRWDSVNPHYSIWMDGKNLEDAYPLILETSGGVSLFGAYDNAFPLDGAIDKIGRWNDWLSDSELRDIYEGIPIDRSDPRLICLHEFGESSGSISTSLVGSDVLTFYDLGVTVITPARTPFFTYTQKKAFAGVLTDRDRKTILGTKALSWTLGFTDFSAQADRRRVFEKYTNTTNGAMIRDIVTKYLAEFGVTIGVIEDGGSVDEIIYNGQSCTDVFNEAAKKDGFAWRIDDDQRFFYQPQKSYAAPWNITNEEGNFVELHVKDSLTGYRNRQFQRGPAQSVSDPRTEAYPGDGVRREFKLLYKPYEKPAIAINGVAVDGADIGIKGLVSGKKWYWTQESSIIEQDASQTILGATDTIAVTYRGIVSMTVEIENGDDIAARAAAEGTSGVYEALDEDSSAIYLNLCIQAGETHMRQNPFDKDDITFDTYRPGLRAGMAQSITNELLQVDTVALIKSVKAKELASQDRRLTYSVACVTGEKADDWLDYFRKISNTKSYSMRENEIIGKCVSFQATCKCLDNVIVVTRPAARVGYATVGGYAAW